ncbi:uncharacterized protein LOC123550103 [Mercenaria mercenaria]|uniref:uncharacterized protein LOC123550103 n=1 Tax=Mercenaria mercenaria TaxID=6596 RepID=UPI00234F3540|nr:uncharacterized protein LOC123550103 [Mercenaria mercenaria]
MMTVTALLACYFARRLDEIYDTLRRWDNSEKHFRRLKPLYLLLQYPSFIWSIIGAAMTGQTGVCSDAEKPCYYTVNDRENRAIAIVIIVVHVINGVISFITLSTRHKIRRDKDVDLNLLQKRSDLSNSISLSLKPSDSSTKKENNNTENLKKDTRETLPPIKEPQPLKKHISRISNGPIFDENDTNRRNVLPPLKQQLKRHHTVHGPIRSADDRSLKPQGKIQNEATASSLSSNTNESKIRRLITKVSIVPPKNRHASFVQPRNKVSDDSSASSDDSDINQRPKSVKKNGLSVRRLSEHPKALPPSYDQAIAPSDTDPYWLPDPPQNDSSVHYLPENMYTGYSYPDTDIEPVQPSKVVTAQWQIR